MSKLDELIQELCPDGVEFCPLEQCCNILDRKRKPVTKSAREAETIHITEQMAFRTMFLITFSTGHLFWLGKMAA